MSEIINGLEVSEINQEELKVTNPDTRSTLYLHRKELEHLLHKLPE